MLLKGLKEVGDESKNHKLNNEKKILDLRSNKFYVVFPGK